MAGRQMMLWAVVVAVAVAGVRSCTHNRHCDEHDCCRVGFMRYSSPTCSPRGDVGTPCSPAYNNPSGPRTLHYPQGFKIEVEEVYFGLCPCRSGLVCASGSCQRIERDPAPSHQYNSISSEYD